jgi:prophage regulatory protein
MGSTNRVLRRKAVLDKIGISSTLLFNLEKAGDFPSHFMLTPRCAVWSEAAVDEWLEQRAVRNSKALAGPARRSTAVGAKEQHRG